MPRKNELESFAEKLPTQEAAFLATLLQNPVFRLFIQPYLENLSQGSSLSVPESAEVDGKKYGFPQQDFIGGHTWFRQVLDWAINKSNYFFDSSIRLRKEGKDLFYNMERAALLIELHTQSVAYVGKLPLGRDENLPGNIKLDFLKKIVTPRMLAAFDLIDSDIADSPQNQLFVSPESDVWLVTDVLSYKREQSLTAAYTGHTILQDIMEIREDAFNNAFFFSKEPITMRYRRIGNRPMLLLINETLSEQQIYDTWEPKEYKPQDLENLEAAIAKAEAAGFTLSDNRELSQDDVIRGVLMHFPGDLSFE